jgi:hypothetical protein
VTVVESALDLFLCWYEIPANHPCA